MSKVSFCNVTFWVQGSEDLANKMSNILESLPFIEKNSPEYYADDEGYYFITFYQDFTLEQLKVIQDTLIGAGFRF